VQTRVFPFMDSGEEVVAFRRRRRTAAAGTMVYQQVAILTALQMVFIEATIELDRYF